jgi:DMSO/TMAO reductase YedYZ molybdopterin-dependent catalytic subunit
MLAVVPATLVGAWLALGLGWASPLEGPAEHVMQTTPLDIATFLLLNLHGETSTLAGLGAFAVLLLGAGVSGVVFGLIPIPILRSLAAATAFSLFDLSLLGSYDPRSGIVLSVGFGVALLLMELASRRNDRRLAEHPPPAWAAAKAPDVPNQAASAGIGATARDRAAEHRMASSIGGRALPDRRQFVADSSVILGGAALLTATPLLASTFLPFDPTTRYFPYAPPSQPDGYSLPGLTRVVTPANEFYVNSKNLYSPRPNRPRLEIAGLVHRPLALSMSDLEQMRRVDEYVTMECVDNPVGGPLIGTALWSGVRLRELLNRAGIREGAEAVNLRALDGYAESIPLEVALRDDTLVVYAMHGKSLSPDHGYPLRLLVPGLYGFKSVKWLTSIRIDRIEQKGMWQLRGWTKQARVATTTRIDIARPRGRALAVAGMAYAGNRGVSRVQVRAGSSAWRDATLSYPLSPLAWRLWKIRIPIVQTTEDVVLEGRAFDAAGVAQAAGDRGAYPDGASGYAVRRVSFG